MSTFEETIINEVSKKALKGIDIEAMAARLRPQLEKKLEAGLVRYVLDDFDWSDIVYNSDISEVLETVAKEAVCKAFNITLPKKKGGR